MPKPRQHRRRLFCIPLRPDRNVLSSLFIFALFLRSLGTTSKKAATKSEKRGRTTVYTSADWRFYECPNCNKMINLFVKYTEILSVVAEATSSCPLSSLYTRIYMLLLHCFPAHECGAIKKFTFFFGTCMRGESGRAVRLSQVGNRYRKKALKTPFILNSLGLDLARFSSQRSSAGSLHNPCNLSHSTLILP
jgi:hypothetical protein